MATLTENPLHCVHCNLEVAPTRLDLTVENVDSIAHWNSLYQSIYLLWIDSGEYESWAESILRNLNTQVNRAGRELASELSAMRRCFYWGFQALSLAERCPGCQSELAEVGHSRIPQVYCLQCFLIFALVEEFESK